MTIGYKLTFDGHAKKNCKKSGQKSVMKIEKALINDRLRVSKVS